MTNLDPGKAVGVVAIKEELWFPFYFIVDLHTDTGEQVLYFFLYGISTSWCHYYKLDLFQFLSSGLDHS